MKPKRKYVSGCSDCRSGRASTRNALDNLGDTLSKVKRSVARYPEHEKLKQVSDKSQICGEFLSWLIGEKGMLLSRQHEHTDGCFEKSGHRICGYCQGDLEPWRVTPVVDLLAEFFEINQAKLEREKVAILRDFRKQQNRLDRARAKAKGCAS